jgi:hypothetical protein
MTDMTLERRADFRIGRVLNRAWDILAPNAPLFIGITFIVALPSLLYLVRDPRLPGYIPLFLIAVFGGIVVNAIGQAVLLFGAFQQLRGEPVRMGEAVQRALARFFPLIGVGILSGLGFILGFIFLVVPGLILITMWSVAIPVCLVEGLGSGASLTRSSELTKGHRWQIFGIIILLGIISAVVGGLIGFVLSTAGLVVAALAKVIWTAVWTAYWNCALIMIYHDLRVAKEGVDTEQIAAIFD